MIAQFYGGPLDGESKKLPDGMSHFYVAHLPDRLPLGHLPEEIHPSQALEGTYKRDQWYQPPPENDNVCWFKWEGWGS